MMALHNLYSCSWGTLAHVPCWQMGMCCHRGSIDLLHKKMSFQGIALLRRRHIYPPMLAMEWGLVVLAMVLEYSA